MPHAVTGNPALERTADTRTTDPVLERVWAALATVHDPEIPVLNIVEMGLVRVVEHMQPSATDPNVGQGGSSVRVVITPTFSGCPALHVIEANVTTAMHDAGVEHVEVSTRLSPPWSTDEMTAEARCKLEEFGIAPPQPHGGLLQIALDAPVRCPRCGYPDTRLRNAFGSALCREIRTCQACEETFEAFKPL